jgi:hypothetical protein
MTDEKGLQFKMKPGILRKTNNFKGEMIAKGYDGASRNTPFLHFWQRKAEDTANSSSESKQKFGQEEKT